MPGFAFLGPVDLQKTQLLNPVYHNSATDIATPVEGQFYYNTANKAPRWFDGTVWKEASSSAGTITAVAAGDLSPLFTTTETGTTSISIAFNASTAAQNAVLAGPASGGTGAYSFRALVQADIPATIPLSYWAAPTANVAFGGFKITGLADGTSAQDAVTLAQLQSSIAGMTGTTVRAATTANGTLATAFVTGSVIDGVTLATGDLILVKNQTTQAENGIRVVAASGAPPRATMMDTAVEVDGSFVVVQDGTQAGTLWITTSEVTTLNTDAIVWIQFNSAADILAGNGLIKSGNTVSVLLDGGANSGLAISGSGTKVSLATTSGLSLTAGLSVVSDTVTAGTLGVTVTSNGVGVKYNTTSFSEASETLTLASTVVSATGAILLSSNALGINVDNTTIEINTNALRVKAAGITHTHISSTALGAGLSGGSGTTLSVTNYTSVSGTTVARVYTVSQTIATGTNTYTLTHNLNSKNVVVMLRDASDSLFLTQIVANGVNTVQITPTNATGSSIAANITIIG